MDLWIIQNGEKIGPIHDFDVRKMIENGELPATTPAWHEGLTAWKPLAEISLFEREYERPPETCDAPGAPAGDVPDPSVVPLAQDASCLIRRFWARWFDLHLFVGVWWFAMWAAGRDIEATLNNPLVILFQYVPWFVLETFLLHRFGTTPGKWLLGLKVVNNDASLLSLGEATRRSAGVLCIGLGFGWVYLVLICQIMAYFNAKRLGRPFWDHSGGHHVTAAPLKNPLCLTAAGVLGALPWLIFIIGIQWGLLALFCAILAYFLGQQSDHSSAENRGTAAPQNPLRVVVFVCVLHAALMLQMIVLLPYAIDNAVRTFPEFREKFEKTPPWHLPKNS